MESEWHRGVRTRIAEYLRTAGFEVRSSHEKTGKLPLYDGAASRSTFTSDVDIIAIKDGTVKLMVEVQGSIRPKATIGIIGDTYISNTFYDKKLKVEYSLSAVTLIIVTKTLKTGSKKTEQANLIKNRLHLEQGKGCLKQFITCTENNFAREIAGIS